MNEKNEKKEKNQYVKISYGKGDNEILFIYDMHT